MDRVIQYRAKRLDNGNWIYGFPLTNKLGTYIIFEKNVHECTLYRYLEIEQYSRVNPDTLGQYTNQKYIYEGDIVKFKYFNTQYIGKVVFNDKTSGFEIWYNNVVGAYGEEATHKINFAMVTEIEVIGNIYENPELLQ